MKKVLSIFILFSFLVVLTACPPKSSNDTVIQNPNDTVIQNPIDESLSCAENPKLEKCYYRQTWTWNLNRYGFDGKGQKVKIYVYDVRKHDPLLSDYCGDRQYELSEHLRNIEKAYHIDIEYLEYPEAASWGIERAKWIEAYYDNKNQDPAIFELDNKSYNLINQEKLLPLSNSSNNIMQELNISFDYKESYGLFSQAYEIARSKPDHFLFYNQDIIDEYNFADPATLWNNREWNYLTLKTYLRQKQIIATRYAGEQIYAIGGVTSHHLVGLMASNGYSFTTNSFELNEWQIPIWESKFLNDIYQEGLYNPDSINEHFSESFINGKEIFTSGKLSDLDQLPEGFNVSAVPYPKDYSPYEPEEFLENYLFPVDPFYVYAFLKNPEYESNIAGKVLVNIIDDLVRGIVPAYDWALMDEDKYEESRLRKYIKSNESIKAIKTIWDADYFGLDTSVNIIPLIDQTINDPNWTFDKMGVEILTGNYRETLTKYIAKYKEVLVKAEWMEE